jgi:periplasmic mercuric ion binding protein
MNFTKSILALAIAGTIFASCKNSSSEAIPEAKEPTAATSGKSVAAVGKTVTTSFHIEGMSCAVMCASKIEKELSAMEGVQKATVDFEKKTATVEYDSAKQTPEKFVEKVESVADGKTYTVSDVKSSGDQAMLFQEKEKKSKKSKKSKKDEASTTTAPSATGTPKEEKKAGCCSGKKHCSKPATL